MANIVRYKGYKKREAVIQIFDTALELADASKGSAYMAGRVNEKWAGGQGSLAANFKLLELGDLNLADKSSAMLSELEDLDLPSSVKHETVATVAGGFVNVPVFLSGAPTCMRLRRKVKTQSAPLTVIVDTTSSAIVSNDKLMRRGMILLALVQKLSEVRPVTLYAGCALDRAAKGSRQGAGLGACYLHINTAPLDLARAAVMLSHPLFSRTYCYAAIQSEAEANGHDYLGRWPYDSAETWNNVMTNELRPVFGTDILAIAPVHSSNEAMLDNPAQWLKTMIKKYSDIEGEMAA